MSPQGRILFIDAYDSFSNNIISLLRRELQVIVESIKIDDPRFVLNDDAFFNFLQHFDAVVAGPGPGHPGNPTDAGLISRLWNLPAEYLLPVLGICFGFQSLALNFGAKVAKLSEPRHGMVAPIVHCNRDIFSETGEVNATQYHSLHVQLYDSRLLRDDRELWTPSKLCRQLIPLAWDISDAEKGAILMALRHCHMPFWGVQYHPESICTSSEGGKLVSNWWCEVIAWRSRRPAKRDSVEPESIVLPLYETPDDRCSTLRTADVFKTIVHWRALDIQNNIDIPNFIHKLRTDNCEPLILESGLRNNKPVNQETGRFSIIGVHDASSTHIQYSTESHRLNIVSAGRTSFSKVVTISKVFESLKTFIGERPATRGPSKVPFWGGLMGFISYEAGLETISVTPSETREDQPDLWFVFVERSLVVDHLARKVYIQSIRSNDNDWLGLVERKLQFVDAGGISRACKLASSPIIDSAVALAPQSHEYKQKVRGCQDHLRAGSSYELCLTDTSHIRTDIDSWNLYLRLRAINPAPFGAYFHLRPNCSVFMEITKRSSQGVSIISSSPERFLSWSRNGKCQFRPIKGTVKKAPGVNRVRAEELLNCPKERAENLMIVDLIRHDLNGVEGVRNVQVPKLMTVEEYPTVFQLVSVIEGDLDDERSSGVDVLAASLPPGSMTGAPKKRSCELLKEIEKQIPRGLYSGVLGYLDVGGGGDFSVVIRTAFKWDDENGWRVGAGGAVTALSEPEAEWKEMNAKRESLLQTFDVSSR